MSFFDDDYDEPTHIAPEQPAARRGFDARAARARLSDLAASVGGNRPRGGGGGRPGGPSGRRPSGGMPDPQTARVRQLVALGAIVLILILLVVAISSCVSSARVSDTRNYSRDVTSLLTESRDQVGIKLFDSLESGDDSAAIASTVSGIADTASKELTKAKSLKAPGNKRGKSAQYALELAMSLRAQAVRSIAGQVRDALADASAATPASRKIAGQVEALVASDVILASRTVPLINEELADVDIVGANVTLPKVVQDGSWVLPATVLENMSSNSSGSTTDSTGEVAPGRHGHGLSTVSFGGTALQTGAANSVSGSSVTVGFQNQGDNDEKNVEVRATLTVGGKSVTARSVVKSTTKGQSGEVTLNFSKTPPVGDGTLKIEVVPVPGEEGKENNTATYNVSVA